MRQYTIIYALTRDLRFSDDAREVPQHECYHHFSRVTAENPIAAEDLCRADALPGFTYQRIVLLEEQPSLIALGRGTLCHVLEEKKIEEKTS